MGAWRSRGLVVFAVLLGACTSGGESDGVSPSILPSAMSQVELDQECEASRRVSRPRKISYTPDEEMVVGGTEVVSAQIALFEGALRPFPNDPSTTIENVDTTCVVTAELSGDSFRINAIGPTEQSFARTQRIEFSWEVTPTEAGTGLHLFLTITPTSYVDGRPEYSGVARRVATISVEATKKESNSAADRVGTFLAGGVAEVARSVAGALGATIVGLGVARVRRTRKKAARESGVVSTDVATNDGS